MRKGFENRMVRHVRTFFREPCLDLGDEGTRKAVAHGIRRAASYGIVAQRDVCQYINVMFTFGRNFDADPAQPWAARILGDESITNPSKKMDAVYNEALLHTDDATPIGSDTQEAPQ